MHDIARVLARMDELEDGDLVLLHKAAASADGREIVEAAMEQRGIESSPSEPATGSRAANIASLAREIDSVVTRGMRR